MDAYCSPPTAVAQRIHRKERHQTAQKKPVQVPREHRRLRHPPLQATSRPAICDCKIALGSDGLSRFSMVGLASILSAVHTGLGTCIKRILPKMSGAFMHLTFQKMASELQQVRLPIKHCSLSAAFASISIWHTCCRYQQDSLHV